MRSKNQSNRISLNLLKTQNVEVILSQIKLLRPKIINKKVTQKNSENKIEIGEGIEINPYEIKRSK